MTDQSTAPARLLSVPTEDEARTTGARLLEAGIAPLIDPGDRDGEAVWWVSVLAHDRDRACEILGIEPEPVELDPAVLSEGDWEPVRTRWWRPSREDLIKFVAVYAVLLVIVTGLAFAVTVWLLGGFDESDPYRPENRPAVTAPVD